MLRVDLRDLAAGPVETTGSIGPADPLFEGLGVGLTAPVVVAGRLQATGEGRFYWHGRISTTVREQCRRCLTDVSLPVTADIGVLFTQDGADDDPDAYVVPADADEVDITPAVREELILAVPQYALCREDCRGLCPNCGKDRNAGPCGCATPSVDPRWRVLEALKLRGKG